jgi:deferrochelatase/peroxidase EfeB
MNGFSPSRRGLIGAALTGAAASALPLAAEARATPPADREPFFGPYQGGIVTPAQRHTYLAAFDLDAETRGEVAALMKTWTLAAARLTDGRPVEGDLDGSRLDAHDILELSPQRLTITFGFGATLFEKEGKDRYGLGARRPAAFVDLPKFKGDQLIPERTGGDLTVQTCADDPQVAFHALRTLARLAEGKARLRWSQTGFVGGFKSGETARNLMGFKDGTMNPDVRDANLMREHVWAGPEGGEWMTGGSYLVARPARIALEHWDHMKETFQEQTMGRRKGSGAPMGKDRETDKLDLDAVDKDGNPLVAENSHVRLAAPESNNGAQMLRRSYSYNNGLSFTTERWPPWRQGMEYDAGLLFVCYQRDPRRAFIPMFEKMSRFDMMNQFVTHIGGGLYACPRGAKPGEYVGQPLLEG